MDDSVLDEVLRITPLCIATRGYNLLHLAHTHIMYAIIIMYAHIMYAWHGTMRVALTLNSAY